MLWLSSTFCRPITDIPIFFFTFTSRWTALPLSSIKLLCFSLCHFNSNNTRQARSWHIPVNMNHFRCSWTSRKPWFTALQITCIQDIHKRRLQFQKLTRNLFLALHGHNVHRQQRQLSKFLMRYQQFASHSYCGASFQDGVAARKGFLCAPFWGVQICDYSAAWVSCTV